MYNPMYPGQMSYNPMATAQQRLAQMEQQYPQFAQPQQPIQGMQPISQNFAPNQQPMYMKCRAVTSFDEAKAAMIDLDGSLHVFTDVANGKIYTKQINLDGTATLNVYSRVPIGDPGKVDNSPNENPVGQDVFNQTINSLKKEIADLRAKFEQRGEMNAKPDASSNGSIPTAE